MDSLAQLLFPVTCLLCGDSGLELCHGCDQKILRNSQRMQIDDVTLWAAAYYGEELAKIILLAKEKNNAQARNFLAQLLVKRIMEARSGVESSETLILIPLPSSPAANRARGFRHGYLLAKGVARLLSHHGESSVEAREYLYVNRRIADQSNLNRAQRASNLADAYSVKLGRNFRGSSPKPSHVYLIDDLVTSGASAREGLRALRSAGIAPLGVLSAAVSSRVSTGVFS